MFGKSKARKAKEMKKKIKELESKISENKCTISRKNEIIYELEKEVSSLKSEVAHYEFAKDGFLKRNDCAIKTLSELRSSERIVPEGCKWPSYRGGGIIKPGDNVCGRKVKRIEILANKWYLYDENDQFICESSFDESEIDREGIKNGQDGQTA